MQKGKKLLLFIVFLAGISWVMFECKYSFSYWMDVYQRPWAYSRDENAKLLVGHWEGSFSDPKGIKKNITLEIFTPLTDDERQEKAGRRTRNRRGLGSTENKRAFDGQAIVTSQLGIERYEIYGSVEKDDFHQFHFNFRPEDEKKRILPNFTLLEARKGSWQNDDMSITLSFAHHNADGSSSYSSEGIVKNGKIEWQENQDDKRVSLTLTRQKP